jgi:aminoglycoside phosphotransferase (APT) family kinase protein
MAKSSAPRFAVTLDRAGVPGDLDGRLLAFVRRELGDPTIGYAEPPSPILGGFETLIYGFRLARAPAGFSGPLILRVFRAEAAREQALYETAVQNAVADLGFPAPRVVLTHTEAEPLGAAFTIMERMPGSVMLNKLLSPAMARMPLLLARTHARLHALDASAYAERMERAGARAELLSIEALLDEYERRITAAQLPALRPGLRWLASQRLAIPGRASICHGDFHPLNVLVDDDDVTGVVDWAWVMVGPAEYDVGAAVALFTQGPVNVPGFAYPLIGVPRRWLVRRYLRAYSELHALDLEALRYYEALRLLQFLIEAGEAAQGEAGVIARSTQLSPFGQARVQRAIITRVRQITGERVSLPRAPG